VLTVQQLAELLQVSAVEVIKQLMRNGVIASINQSIDFDTAAIVAADFGYEAQEAPSAQTAVAAREGKKYLPSLEDSTVPRPPIVTVMGHVDHGKTSLLDAIRQTNVIATEVGGITQHIGAYQVEVNGRKITFLDTPGHEAFTAMRARGAQVTDIAVLVVAADDGVMPQTVEAINHARAAGVPIVVAINKIDKPNANPELVKKQLAEQGLLIEEWGGDVVCVPISAKRKQGISDLLENILLVADMLELRANPQLPAEGVVIEAGLDKTKGPLATVLVQSGTFAVGDIVVVGDTWGKIKAMFNDKGKRVKKADPATPVKILGLNSVPQAGDTFLVVSSEREARTLAHNRQQEKQRALLKTARAPSLDDLFAQIQEGKVKELNVVLKTDVQGSIEPIKNSLERLSTDQVKVKVIHSDSGSITESDVLLALASKGIIIGFGTRVEPGAKRLAEMEGVDIRNYQVIYNLVEDVEKALKGMLEPVYMEVMQGQAEVRAVFPVGKKGKVAGVYVSEGKVSRNDLARILRNGEIIHQSSISSLRRFKEDVKEVPAGFECGVGIEGFIDFQVGDIIQAYRKERQN
jgi:translation initiation factor IF-2